MPHTRKTHPKGHWVAAADMDPATNVAGREALIEGGLTVVYTRDNWRWIYGPITHWWVGKEEETNEDVHLSANPARPAPDSPSAPGGRDAWFVLCLRGAPMRDRLLHFVVWWLYRSAKFLAGIPHLWRISGDRAAEQYEALKMEGQS